ncbi:MAG: hypothetical protein U0R19_18470 [Bryobacteraceae bacterium]
MPFLDRTEHPDLPVFMNITFAVGKNGANARDDVAWVQFLLEKFYSKKNVIVNTKGETKTFTRPKGNLTLDGICGPVTNNFILKFQLDINRDGPFLVADGRVDRALIKAGKGKQSVTGSISKLAYSIVMLNFLYKLNFPKEFEIDFSDPVFET